MPDSLGFMRPATPLEERIEEATRLIDLQNKEFEALSELTDRYNDICLTAVVDDDYPRVRRGYEDALKAFIEALKNNGRL